MKGTRRASDDGAAPSTNLDKRIGSLIRSSYRKTIAKRFIKVGKAVACFCVVLTIISVILLSVGATRNAIFNAIVKWHEQYTEIRYEHSPHDTVIYRPSYLPEGFREISVKPTVNSTTVIYENESGDQIFFVQQQVENASMLVDNENADFIEISISGNPGFLFKASTDQDSSVLVWEKDGNVQPDSSHRQR